METCCMHNANSLTDNNHSKTKKESKRGLTEGIIINYERIMTKLWLIKADLSVNVSHTPL